MGHRGGVASGRARNMEAGSSSDVQGSFISAAPRLLSSVFRHTIMYFQCIDGKYVYTYVLYMGLLTTLTCNNRRPGPRIYRIACRKSVPLPMVASATFRWRRAL